MSLEKFIDDNRQQFDAIEPVQSDAIWIGIQQQRRRARVVRFARIGVAASVLIAASITILIQLNKQSNDQWLTQTQHTELQEGHYYQLAADKKDKIGFDQLNKETYSEIMEELDMLETMYEDLKREIANSPDAERAIQTAIRFHERRLHILELLEKEIENQKRTEEHEKSIKI